MVSGAGYQITVCLVDYLLHIIREKLMLVNLFFGMICKFGSFVTFSSKKGNLTWGQIKAIPQFGFSVTLS